MLETAQPKTAYDEQQCSAEHGALLTIIGDNQPADCSVMNLLWVAALAGLVAIEKLSSKGVVIGLPTAERRDDWRR
jgi:hypothetical protein